MNAPQAREAQASPWQDRLGRASIRSLQVLAVLSLLVVGVWVAVQLRLVVVPLLIAVLIAAAASPIVSWLNRRGLPRAPSVWATLLTGFAIFGGLVWAVARAAQDQWSELAEGVSQGVTELERYLAESPLGIDQKRLEELWSQAGELLAGPQGQGVLTGATLVVEIIAGIFLGLVLLYFLLKDGERIWNFLRDELLPNRHSHRFDMVADEAVSTLGGYVRGTALIALVEAIIIGTAVAILGVPLALPIAIVVFIGAFIPLLGATAAGALAALIALVSNGVVAALILVAVVIVVNQLEGDILAPYVLGKTLSLHPLAVLLALSAGTISAGIIGAILSVPFAAVTWSAITTWRTADGTQPEEAPRSAPAE